MKPGRHLLMVWVLSLAMGCLWASPTTPVEPSAETGLPTPTRVDETQTELPQQSPGDGQTGALIQRSDFEYLGAFRLPEANGGSSWDYSGRGLTYFPAGDPNGEADGLPGSLFGVGNDQQQFVSEISIPAPVRSKNPEDLPFAHTLQPFADITGGMLSGMEIPRLGIQYLAEGNDPAVGRIHFTFGQHFQDFQPSHGWASTDLSNPQPAGPWIFDGYTNYVSNDYIFEIPAGWSQQIAGNPRLVSGRFREGVWGGFGPAMFAYNPNPDGSGVQDISALLLYGEQIPGQTEISANESTMMTSYNADDSWWGGAWLTIAEKSAVILVGTKASGDWWYGFANGVRWEYDCADQNPPTCPEVPPWPNENRGFWAETYQPEILFFNPNQLVDAANGRIETWQPQPYASLDLSEFFFNPVTDPGQYKFEIAGASAFDHQRGLLYVFERLADGYKSVIHVWRVK